MSHKSSLAGAIGVAAVALTAVLLHPLIQAAAFWDVAADSTHADAIAFVNERGIMTGNPDGTFRPESTLNRAEMAKLISPQATKAGCSVTLFPDVRPDAWYFKHVCAAKEHNIISGYPDGTFKPANTITLAEAAKMIVLRYGDAETANAVRASIPQNSQWYAAFIAHLNVKGAIPPTITSLEQHVTRGEVAEMLFHLLGNPSPFPHWPSSISSSASALVTDENIAYGNDPAQKLDVTYDPHKNNAPVMVLVHGGGWIQGSKEEASRAAPTFTDVGFVFINPNYRLATKERSTFPEAVQDVACVIAWAKANASRYGGDPSRIVVGGHSAGAHLTALIAYNPDAAWLQGCETSGQSLAVSGFIGSGGPYDFNLIPESMRGPNQPLRQFLGSFYGPGTWDGANVINFVSVGDPPALILIGTKDPGFPQNEAFAKALESKNVYTDLRVFQDGTHDQVAAGIATDPEIKAMVEKFLIDIGILW